MRSAGSQGWAGVWNSHFWFDPKADAMGLLMTQSLPFVEPRFMATYQPFEQATYRHLQAVAKPKRARLKPAARPAGA